MARLAGIPADDLMLQGERFAVEAGLQGHIDEFRKGALVAQNPTGTTKKFKAFMTQPSRA